MKKIMERFQRLKLNIKFTVIIIFFVVVCMAVLSVVLFYNMEQNVLRQQTASMEYKIEKNYGQIVKNVETINMSTQIFLNYNVPIDVDIKFDPNPISWTLKIPLILFHGHLLILLSG